MPRGKTISRIGFSGFITPWRLANRKIPERNALMWANVVDVSLCCFAIASRSFSRVLTLTPRTAADWPSVDVLNSLPMAREARIFPVLRNGGQKYASNSQTQKEAPETQNSRGHATVQFGTKKFTVTVTISLQRQPQDWPCCNASCWHSPNRSPRLRTARSARQSACV